MNKTENYDIQQDLGVPNQIIMSQPGGLIENHTWLLGLSCHDLDHQ